ncbi:hypothetical protein QR680_018966 [Steinernema hermaphroditum]|uniref:PABS domain-containing protein n=1 Tax=Steinernema hermaphroditum TaxID=289476 RepID=A0AA39LR56_9BILA|nr:hypothetical protein QR680_018966 [Steinernema hermaphroditum]
MKFTDLLDRFPQFYVKYMTSSESKTLVSPQRTRIERVDRICAESGGGCYVVSDFVDSKTNEAWRAIHSEKATNSSQMESHFSRAALIVQNDTTSSKDWSVDHTTILAQYIAVMAALPFATGSLLKAKPTILSIGLGGGVLDMFLHTARPKFEVTVVESDPTIIDIAHKWFGVEETTNRKTVNDSGIDFLSNTVKNDRYRIPPWTPDSFRSGRQYDVVFVDACDLSSDNVTCPSAPFLDRANIADISDSLPTSGDVVVNVVARSDLTEKLYDRVRFRSSTPTCSTYFKMCLKTNMPSGNIVVACTSSVRHGDENLLRDDITNRWNEVANEFGLKESLKTVNITVVLKDSVQW